MWPPGVSRVLQGLADDLVAVNSTLRTFLSRSAKLDMLEESVYEAGYPAVEKNTYETVVSVADTGK